MAEKRILRSKKKGSRHQSAQEQPLEVQPSEDSADENELIRNKKIGGLQASSSACDKSTNLKKQKQGADKQHKSFCPSGSMGSFARLRQRQMQNHSFRESESHTTTLPSTKRQKTIETHTSREATLENLAEDSSRKEVVVAFQRKDPPLEALIEDNGMDHAHVSGNENEKEPEVQPTIVPQPEQKRRGPTMLPHIYARKPEERPIIVLNSSVQPIGPTSAIVKEFSRFLGTFARVPDLAPLNYEYWHWLPAGTFDRMWANVLRSYIVPEEGKKWVNATLNDLWCAYKCRIKTKHYNKYDTDDERWENRPQTKCLKKTSWSF